MADESVTTASHQVMANPADILRYDRDELLRLQGALGHLQDDWWAQHVKDLEPDVVEELQELQAVPDTSHLRRRSKNSERRLRSKAKREALHALSANALGPDGAVQQEYDDYLDGSLDPSLRRGNQNVGGRRYVGKNRRNYESFDAEDIPEPESFQPQAFAVEGEPNFESGPPEDGWEYLRRVKYEAARCPKVVVAQIDPTKLVTEQTPYMPDIADIPACSLDLLPSKEWEDHFLGNFSLLRMAMSNTRVPPTFTTNRIPPLQNKTAWEFRCFGSVTTVEDEEAAEVDAVTTKDSVAELKDGEIEVSDKNMSRAEISLDDEKELLEPLIEFPPSSLVSAENESACAANIRRAEIMLDDEKELLEPLIEFIETQVDPLVTAEESEESSFVIDLGLIFDYLPNYYEPEEFFNESEYFISGETAVEADDDDIKFWSAVDPSAGTSGAADGPEASADSSGLQNPSFLECGQLNCSSGIIPHLEQLSIGGPEEELADEVGTKSPSSHPVPGYIESDQQVTQTPESIMVEGHEDERLETGDFMNSFDGKSWTLVEAEFGDMYLGVDSELHDSLAIGDPSEMAVNLSSFSDADEFQELDDVHLPTSDFVDALIGLEVFRSGNDLADELQDDGEDPSEDNNEFKIDGSLEELFIKVFQQIGVAQLPFVHLLLRLDEVSRAALFRHHVSWLENVSGLPKDRALWLLALSAVVDTPLDSQTSAAFRALLRHCSAVRALKQTREDEDLYLLNVLITVAGVYFGQAEGVLP